MILLKVFSILFIVFTRVQRNEGLGEIINPLISADMPDSSCLAAAEVRPCQHRDNLGPITSYPDNYPCPCPAVGSSGGAIVGQGSPSVPNPDAQTSFQDVIIANGFTDPVGMSFTDNTNELFVSTKEGICWRVDLATGIKNVFIDLTAEVCSTGDRGMLSVATFPNFKQNPFILLLYSVKPDYGGPDVDMNMPVNQRLVRYEMDTTTKTAISASRIALIGGGTNDGIPVCYNTHAIGTVRFGHDGSVFISAGEGAHWDFDLGDYGQNQMPLDHFCEDIFGAAQDHGSLRAQMMTSLSGKILRIAPDTGNGICAGSGYPVYNPYCDGDPTSIPSKVWAMGLRNPFRMTVRPWEAGETVGGPGIVYFGDVGEGGYEELNAVISAGLNFGWPCWEGGHPMPKMRDSPYNYPPVNNATWWLDGSRLSCDFMYHHVVTQHPFFYFSRFLINDPAGYFGENCYLGQGFQGNTIAGVAVYGGNIYPSNYKGAVFFLEYSQWWLRVAYKQNDIFQSVEDFARFDTAVLTLEADANGNICYITLNKGEVHCIKYIVTDVAPQPEVTATPSAGLVPLTVQFDSDGTFDRENDPMIYSWNFGDGSATSNLPNPSHTYTVAGLYSVVLTVMDRFRNADNFTLTITANAAPPTCRITSPTTSNVMYYYMMNETLHFACQVSDAHVSTLQYHWEVQIVHLNHFHADQYVATTPTFSLDLAATGLASHGGQRINYRVILTVTNQYGVTATDTIYASVYDYIEEYGGNSPPVPSFLYNGYSPAQALQPVRFDAGKTFDPDLDYIFYAWDWGDGYMGEGVLPTHTYSDAGTYTITLTVHDNFWANNTLTQNITIAPKTVINPLITPASGVQYKSFLLNIFTIEPSATIYYTLDGSTPTTTSPIFTTQFMVTYKAYTFVTIKAIAVATGLQNSLLVESQVEFIPPPCETMALRKDCNMECVNTVTTLENDTIVTIPPANDMNSVAMPPTDQSLIVRYLLDNLNGMYDPDLGVTTPHIWVDGGDIPGQAIQARVSYDFTNDGTWDRLETFQLFACDPIPDSYEEYTFTDPTDTFQPGANGIVGSGYQNLVNGVIRLELWQAIGSGNPPMTILADGPNSLGQQTRLVIPYNTTYQNGNKTSCSLACNGGFVTDVCGVCDGPGLTGCDQQCFSSKVYDSCGVCGGPGKTGCDNQCGSTKTVGTCGVCGEVGNCTAGGPDCRVIGIRSRCPDLICNYLDYEEPNNITIPSADGVGANGYLPSDPSKIVQYEIKNLMGFYNVDDMYTQLNIYVDSLTVAGQALGVQVSYDWTGDGTWDRMEMFSPFTPNNIPDYERWFAIGVPPPTGKLASSTGTWSDLSNGTIPFITTWWSGTYSGNGTCGEPDAPATGYITTADTTTSSSMTATSTAATSAARTATSSSASTTGTTGTTGTTATTAATMTSSSSSASATSTGTASCSNVQCDCNNYTCPCNLQSCQIVNGEVTCVLTQKEDGTQCSVNQPPNFCLFGTCESGKCQPTNGLSECGGTTTTNVGSTTADSNLRQVSNGSTAVPFVELLLIMLISLL